MTDETAVLVWCMACALGWVALGSAIALKSRDGLHIGAIFCFLFALSYPIKLAATGYGFAVMDSARLGAAWQLRALGLANLSAALFTVPVIWGGCSGRAVGDSWGLDRYRRSSGAGWLVAAMVLLVASYGFAALLSVFSFEALTELREQRDQSRLFSASAALMRDAGTFCLIAHFGSVFRRWERLDLGRRLLWMLTWGVAGYVLLAMSASKYMGLLPFAIGLLVANGVRIERCGAGFSLSWTAAVGVLGILGIGLTGYLRGFGAFQDAESVALTALIQASYAFDAPDNLSFILSRIENWWTGDLGFTPTLQYMFLGPIPRVLWPDKPLVMGNLYIMQWYLPERFTDEAGEVVSPSMPGEMLVSGGIWFVVVWSFILGAGFTLVYRWTQRHPESRLAFAAYVWLCLNVFNLLRSGTGIVSPLATFVVMSSVVLITSRVSLTISRGAAVTRDHPFVIGRRGQDTL